MNITTGADGNRKVGAAGGIATATARISQTVRPDNSEASECRQRILLPQSARWMFNNIEHSTDVNWTDPVLGTWR